MNPESVVLALRVVMALALYGFLGAALFILWSEIRRPARGEEGPPDAHVLLLEGDAAGSVYPLLQTNLIGRAADNSIRLSDSTVSAYHLRLAFQGGQWWAEDLGSRNGSAVNDLALEGPMVVTYGDVVRLGKVPLRMERGVHAARPESGGSEEA
jgi:hypothetical protein